MTSSVKWSIDFKAIARSFQNALNFYGTEALIGLVFGRVSEKKVTSVIFLESSSDEQQLRSQLHKISSFFSPEIEVLGLARLSTTPQNASKILAGEEKITLKLEINDLKNLSKGSRRLVATNPTVIDRTNLGYKDMEKLAQVRVNIFTKVSSDLLTKSEDIENLVMLWPGAAENFNACNAGLVDFEKLLESAKVSKHKPVTILLKSDSSKSAKLEETHAPINGGVCSVVQGTYAFHHYRQDGFEDAGWGCAYRSFQTVWSWLRYQNFSTKPIPTHREIQECLVDIGDKKSDFVGSREWIGSLELSYALETMLGISARILPAKSGADSLVEHARAIIYHFDNYGAPIMIGGGQYAYTILGIDYDIRLGKCRFLVLDPHYTGEDDLSKVIKEEWCAWKPMEFWNKKCFYNLLLPINPTIKA